jgi:hypothetical protein
MPLFQDDAFGPDMLWAMSTAREEVCCMLKVDHDQGAREVLAVRIIELARRAAWDPERLCDRVLWEAGQNFRWLMAAPMADARQPLPDCLFQASRYWRTSEENAHAPEPLS